MKLICDFPECGRPRHGALYCQSHHIQNREGLELRPIRPRGSEGRLLRERLEFYTEKNDSGCWLWTGYVSEQGYGQVRVGGDVLKAHRVSLEAFTGQDPSGFEIDHQCRVRSCINPDHLAPVGHKENMENQSDGHAGSTSRLLGVYRKGRKWAAEVGHTVDGKRDRVYLGTFDLEEDAAEAAKMKRLELFTNNINDREGVK